MKPIISIGITTKAFLKSCSLRIVSSYAFDSLNNIIYVSSADIGASSYTVQKFDVEGMLLDQWNSPSTVPTYNGYGIAFDSFGNVFVANTFSHRIEKFTNDGILLTQWGTKGTGDGEFDSPHDIAMDSSDNLYVSDTFNHRVQVFAPVANNHPPVADSQSITMKKNKPVDIILRANNADTDTLTFSIVSGPLHGTATVLS